MNSIEPPIKGRGSSSRMAHRFASDAREPFEDGWEPQPQEPGPPATQVIWEDARSVITGNDSPDVYFDRSINPYRGCEHGCIYCFARPTHAFHDLSPGVDFESRLFVKPDAAQLLNAALSRPGYECRPIAMGTNTDPYQPIEQRWRITRSVIELLLETRHPFTITTKSDRVLRDLDLLVPAAELRIASVAISVTSLDPAIARTLEPRAAQPRKRLAAVKALNDAGVPCFVAIAPVVPQITDHELEHIVEAAVEAGAPGGFYLPVRLPHEVAPLFRAWLDEHFPDRAAKVMATIRSLRGGRDNDPDFFSRMRGQGPWADLLRTRFEIAAKKYGLAQAKFPLRTDLFRPPEGAQMRLI
ncbi:MAG TPA: PA0069 family radical SAM protein [Sphingomicrobium sp.]|nr:PA0069 family radical SAM protein [Sphingomicrobium sp.]